MPVFGCGKIVIGQSLPGMIGFMPHRPPDICAVQVGAVCIRGGEVSMGEFRPGKVGITERCTDEACAGAIRPDEDHLFELRFGEVGVLQCSALETSHR